MMSRLLSQHYYFPLLFPFIIHDSIKVIDCDQGNVL